MPSATEHALLAIRSGRAAGRVRVRLMILAAPLPAPERGVLRLPVQVRHASRRPFRTEAIGLASRVSDTPLLCELALLPGTYRILLGDPPGTKRIRVDARGPVQYGCAHAGRRPTILETRALSEPDGEPLASTSRLDLSPCCRTGMRGYPAKMSHPPSLGLLRAAGRPLRFRVDGRPVRIRPGQYLLADPRTAVGHHPDQPFGISFSVLTVARRGLLRFAEAAGLPAGLEAFSFSTAPRRLTPALAVLIRDLEQALDDLDGSREKTFGALLAYQRLLLHLMETHPPRSGRPLQAPAPRDSDPRVALAVHHIETRHSGPCPVSEVADAAGTSVSLLRRLFQRHLMSSPKDVLQRVRVERAKVLLRERRNSLEQVAAAVGYQDVRSFRRVFKAHTLAQVRAFRGG